MLVPLHFVTEHQRVGAVAVVVAGDAARVEQQLKRPRRLYGGVKPDVYVDFGARSVRAVGGGWGRDVDHGRRGQPDQLDDVFVGVAPVTEEGVAAAAQVERFNVERNLETLKAGHAAVDRPDRQQRPAVPAHVEQLDAAFAVVAIDNGGYGVRAAASGGGGGGDIGDVGEPIPMAQGCRGDLLQRVAPAHPDHMNAIKKGKGVLFTVQVECGDVICVSRQRQRVQMREGGVVVYPKQVDAAPRDGDQGALFAV